MVIKSQFGLKEEIKKILRPLIYKIPNKYRYGKEYRNTYHYLIKNSYNNISLENDLKELLEYAVKNLHLPFTAIGGIKEHNLHEIISRGAKNVCLVSDIVGADDIAEKVRQLQKLIK